jgi:hypothetical protein
MVGICYSTWPRGLETRWIGIYEEFCTEAMLVPYHACHVYPAPVPTTIPSAANGTSISATEICASFLVAYSDVLENISKAF